MSEKKTLKRRTRRSQGAGTLSEVAQAAQVSEMTVSRVLRRKDKVASKTRDHVLKVIKDLGYVPNRLAGALASSTSNQLAVIIPSLRNIVFPEVLSGIADRLDEAGYQAVIGISEYDLQREASLVETMMSWRPAGIIVTNTQHSEEAARILRVTKSPVVEIMDLTEDPIDMCVGLDHHKAGAEMARHLVTKGYRNIGYLGCDLITDAAAGKRYSGFRDTLQEAGLSVAVSLSIDEPSGIGLGRNSMPELLAKVPAGQKIDAVYFSNDAVAVGAQMYCMAEGIRTPEDLALAGFSGLEVGQAMPVPLTTIRSKRFHVGWLSADYIVRRLQGEDPPRVTDAGFELIEGATA